MGPSPLFLNHWPPPPAPIPKVMLNHNTYNWASCICLKSSKSNARTQIFREKEFIHKATKRGDGKTNLKSTFLKLRHTWYLWVRAEDGEGGERWVEVRNKWDDGNQAKSSWTHGTESQTFDNRSLKGSKDGYFKVNFYWSIAALRCCVSFFYTAKCLIHSSANGHIYVSPLFWISFPFRSPQSIQ